MCIIIDASVVHQVFTKRSEAGEAVLNWLNRGGILAIGGKLHDEIKKACPSAEQWIQQGSRSGRIKFSNKSDVEEAEKRLIQEGACESNDAHVIALARVSGARLLYSDDGKLRKDFKNRDLLNSPRGKLYSSLKNKDLLNRNLCARH